MSTQRTPRIRELPQAERPREKMLHRGPRQLELRDLVALILGHGSQQFSALDLADKLLSRFGTLVELADASVEELKETSGVGVVKAARIKAACELARRLVFEEPPERRTIRSAADIADLLLIEMRNLDREEFRAILLDTKHRVLEVATVSIGHLNGTLVHPREVFKGAIRRSSEALIVAHNHPSGDPTPSAEDIAVTKRLVSAGRLLGIELIDHVILGHNDYVSLRQQGYFITEGQSLGVASAAARKSH